MPGAGLPRRSGEGSGRLPREVRDAPGSAPRPAGPAGFAALTCALLAGAAGPLALPLPAQDDLPPSLTRGTLTPDDSADLRDRARDAQERFERVRRRHFPTALGGGSGPCDDRVGRMCWTHVPGSLWWPEPEDEAVSRAREGLLAQLARIAELLPGDEWVLGQRVWYLLEADRPPAALALARGCGVATAWWCAALEGLALHVEGRYMEAEGAFARALGEMEPERAREWEDVRALLDGDARDALGDAEERSPEARDTLVALMWRLADPLLLVPGNERRTEHLARRTVARIRSEARNPHDLSWGDDLAELLVRYGWGVGWERTLPEPGRLPAGVSVVAHEHPDSRVYVPPGSVLRDPTKADAGPWTPRSGYAPSAYAPAYAPVVLPMEARVVVLTRGEEAVVAATWAFPADTTHRTRRGVRGEHTPPAAFAGRPAQAGLFVAAPGGDTVYEARAEGEARGTLWMEVPAGSWWVSVEAVDPALGRAGRLRRGLEIPAPPPDAARVSDLLLVEPGPLPESTDEALRRLAMGDSVTAGSSIVVGWEVWGLGWRAETVRYRLSLEDEGGGLLRRAGEALGIVDPERPRYLEWEEPGPERPGAAFRSVTMDLPDVEPGAYRLRLEIDTPGRTTLVTERRLRVVR